MSCVRFAFLLPLPSPHKIVVCWVIVSLFMRHLTIVFSPLYPQFSSLLDLVVGNLPQSFSVCTHMSFCALFEFCLAPHMSWLYFPTRPRFLHPQQKGSRARPRPCLLPLITPAILSPIMLFFYLLRCVFHAPTDFCGSTKMHNTRAYVCVCLGRAFLPARPSISSASIARLHSHL